MIENKFNNGEKLIDSFSNNFFLEETKKINKKGLRKGFTTGSAATAAAKAALRALLEGTCPEKVKIKTPANKDLEIKISCSSSTHPFESAKKFFCGVKKDAGDDPDVTNNLLIMVEVEELESPYTIEIQGGPGIGTAKKPGLPVEKGEKAINPGPKKMIKENLLDILPDSKGVKVTLWIPHGEKLAKKTLNEKLGIEGGLSILGTTGIVEPLSASAYKDSLYVQLHQIKAMNLKTALFTPGKIGERNARSYKIPEKNIVFMGNFVGDMLKSAAAILDNKTDILFFGHAGKLCKIAAGVFQTHSKTADARREVFITHGALLRVKTSLLEKIYAANTTEEIIYYLKEYSQKEGDNSDKMIFSKIAAKITAQCENFIKNENKLRIGTILTDRQGNILIADENAKKICKKEGWEI